MENIPASNLKRVVILGGGFAGLKLAKKLDRRYFQVVLLDKNNYHQFQPLMYQVATAGLEPSSISFPFRKAFQKQPETYFRIAEVKSVDLPTKTITTDIGNVTYDYLIIATGADTNFFNHENITQHALPMKSVSEALFIRNQLIENLEKALSASDEAHRQELLSVGIVGGGATGVELAGAIAEMKRFVLPKDYPEINFDDMQIYLFESGGRLLEAMSEKSSADSERYLRGMGVHVHTGMRVTDYDGKTVSLSDGTTRQCRMLLWAAGIKSNQLQGIPAEAYGRANRLLVDRYSRVQGVDNVFAVGDGALMNEEPKYPNGHPQVAPAAIQQATLLASNLKKINANQQGALEPYSYYDKGAMATVGRNKAVIDLKSWHFKGFFAWAAWLFVHLMYILGVKNKFFIFVNWAWSYLTYDQSLRLIIRPKGKK